MFSLDHVETNIAGCLQVSLAPSKDGEFSVDFNWVFGEYAADIILDIGKLSFLDEEALEMLREVGDRMNPQGARVLVSNVPQDIALVLKDANLPFDVVTELN